MECYACDNEATGHCSRCGNDYCGDHGAELCADCLDPVTAVPSNSVFRASLFAFLIASVLALWLLIQPPGLPGQSNVVAPPPSIPSPVSTPDATPDTTPDTTPTPAGATRTPVPATPTPTPDPTPEPATPTPGPLEYVVQEGDTLNGIAEAFGIDPFELAAVNGLSDADFLSPGDVLVIPQ